jgi:hypothetical protein
MRKSFVAASTQGTGSHATQGRGRLCGPTSWTVRLGSQLRQSKMQTATRCLLRSMKYVTVMAHNSQCILTL